MEAAIRQTLERRQRQHANNLALGITPRTIVKALPAMGDTTDELIAGTTTGGDGSRRLIAKKGGRKDGDWAQRLNLGAGSWASANEPNNSSIENSNFQLKSSDNGHSPPTLSPSERSELLTELRAEMETAAKSLDFEQAARLRDRIYEIERMNE